METNLKECLIMAFTGFAVGFLINSISSKYHFPKNTNSEYVSPRDIEFKIRDLDFDIRDETYIKIKDREYLFKYVNGNPRLLPYELKLSTGTEK